MSILEWFAEHDAADQRQAADLAQTRETLEQRSRDLLDLQGRYDIASDEVARLTGVLEETSGALTLARGRIAQLEAQLTPPAPVEADRQRLTAIQVFPQRDTHPRYGNHDACLADLADLGIRRVRGLLSPDWSQAVIDFYRRAHDEHGIKSWLTCGITGQILTAADWDRINEILTGPLAGMVEVIAGWNEPNHIRGKGHAPAGWEKAAAKHSQEMRLELPGDILLGTPQLWSGNFADHDADWRLLAPLLGGTYDVLATHLYPRGQVGEKYVTRVNTLVTGLLGDLPIYCTEAGYFTDLTSTSGYPVSEDEQARLWPLHLELYHRDQNGCSAFELYDDTADREGSLGQIKADGTRKPAFAAIRDYLAA